MAGNELQSNANDFIIENVITTALQIPGIKVRRDELLRQYFNKNAEVDIDTILEKGPVEAGCSKETLAKISSKIIFERTTWSSIASFVTGIPGGLAMAATIPADLLQFFGVALRLAQEITYIYGAPDLWEDGSIDNERVQGQLILYCGAMFGVSGAIAGVRFISSQMAKQVAKKLPQNALTKTIWYPIVKKIAGAIGIKVTKSSVAKGISKIVPLVGGVVSGSLNFATMMPMGNRLAKAVEEANFDYSEEDAIKDFETVNTVADDVTDTDIVDGNNEELTSEPENNANKKEEKKSENNPVTFFKKVGSGIGNGISERFARHSKNNIEEKSDASDENSLNKSESIDDIIAKIEKLSKLKDTGALTQEEFDYQKSKLLSKI